MGPLWADRDRLERPSRGGRSVELIRRSSESRQASRRNCCRQLLCDTIRDQTHAPRTTDTGVHHEDDRSDRGIAVQRQGFQPVMRTGLEIRQPVGAEDTFAQDCSR